MRRRFWVAFIVLCALTVALTVWNVSLAMSPADEPVWVHYKANVISKPQLYWSLTDPDQHILQAISTPGTWFQGPRNETTFLDQVEEHNDIWNIEYQGNYYEIEAIGEMAYPWEGFPEWVTLHDRTTAHISSILVLGASWGVFGIVLKRDKAS